MENKKPADGEVGGMETVSFGLWLHQPFDLGAFELASVGGEENYCFADHRALNAEATASADFAFTRTDVTHRADVETERVGSLFVENPFLWDRREALAFGHPVEFHDEFVVHHR